MEPIPDLTEELDEQLNWHFRADAGLERLRKKLRSQARPRPKVLPFARRLATVAALLLVTFATFTSLSPLSDFSHDGGLSGVLAERLDRTGERTAPKKSANDPPGFASALGHQSVARMSLEPKDRSPEEIRQTLASPTRRGTVPPGPRVNLALEVVNRGDRPLTLKLGEESTRLDLDLSGTGVFTLTGKRVTNDSSLPFLTKRSVRLEPGESYPVTIPYLVGGTRGRLQGVYWDRAGRYVLRATLKVRVVDDLGRPRDLYVRGKPILLEVSDP